MAANFSLRFFLYSHFYKSNYYFLNTLSTIYIIMQYVEKTKNKSQKVENLGLQLSNITPSIRSRFNISKEINPNGSVDNIAGIFNKEQNILGMMPHPERMIEKVLSGNDGSLFFENLLKNYERN